MALIVCILLIFVSLFLWIYVSALSIDVGGSDAAGNAMGAGFAALGSFALWGLLAIALIVAWCGGEMPWWGFGAGLILLAASVYAVNVALELRWRSERYSWVAATAVGVPPLVAVYCLWGFYPRFHSESATVAIGSFVWGGALVLTAVPLVTRWARDRAIARIPPKTAEEIAAEEAARKEEERKQRAERFVSLTADSPFRDWWDFAREGSEFRERALAGLVKVNNREGQIAKMLEDGTKRELFLLVPKLELQALPEMEGGIRAFLRDQVRNLMPYDAARPMATSVVTEWFEQYFPVIAWLKGNGGSCDAELGAIAEAVGKYPDGEERRRFLGELKGLRAETW